MIQRFRDFSGGLQGGITPKDRAPNSLSVMKDLELDRPYLALSRRQVFNSVLGGTLPVGVTLEGSGIRTRLRKGQITVLRGVDNKLYLREAGNYAVVTRTAIDGTTSNPVYTGGSCGFAVVGNVLRIFHAGNLSTYTTPDWISHFDRNYFRLSTAAWFASVTSDALHPSHNRDIIGPSFTTIGVTAYNSAIGYMGLNTYMYAATLNLDGYQESEPIFLFSQALTGNQNAIDFTLRIDKTTSRRATGCTIYRVKQGENVWWALATIDFTYNTDVDPDSTADLTFYTKGGSVGGATGRFFVSQFWTSNAGQMTKLVSDRLADTDMITQMTDRRGYSPLKLKKDGTWEPFELLDAYRDMAVVRGRTFVVGTLADERKVFFCNINGDGVFEHDIFPPGNYLEFPRRVQRIIEDNESLRVFTDAGIHRVIFGGETKNDWNIEMGEAGSGTRSPRSVAVLQGRPLFMGQDTLRSIQGEQSIPTPGLPIQDIIDATTDVTTAYAEVRPARGEYWLGINSRLVVLKENAWREISKANLNIIQTENGEVALVTSTDLLSLSGTGSEPVLAITFDAASSVVSDTTPITLAHTVGIIGGNRLLRVSVSFVQDASQTVASVTYAGQSMIKKGDATNAGQARAELWYLINPSTGLNNIVVTMSAAAEVIVGADSYYEVNQVTPFGTIVTATGTTLAATVDVSSATDELVIDVYAKKNTTEAVSVGAGQTSRWNTSNVGTNGGYGGGSSEPGAASVTMSWTWTTTNRNWAILAVPLKSIPNMTIELKTNIIDFDQPEYLKRLDWMELVYTCDTAVTVEVFYDRSSAVGTTLTFPIQTAYGIQKQYIPMGKHGKEFEVRITAPSTHTSFRLEELSMSAEIMRKFGEG